MYQHPGNRPRFLRLTSFHFPLNAKLSALHRITGLMLIASLLGYLALFNLIVFHPSVTISSVVNHCIHKCLYSLFWSALAFHWLTGLRHILAEHFTQPHIYQKINSLSANLLIIALWCLITVLIIYQAWSGFTV